MPPPGPPPSVYSVAPGWYFDGRSQRWWDGTAWGPVAPDSNDRTLATLSHLGALMGGFILPLVLYLVSDDEKRPETRHHAREALNFQITFAIVHLVGFVAMFIGLAAGGLLGTSGDTATTGAGFGLGISVFFGFFALIFAVSIGSLVFAIIAAVRANKGERYRYPLCIRFIGS